MTRTITGTETIGRRSFHVIPQAGVPGVEPIHGRVSAEGVYLLDAATRENTRQHGSAGRRIMAKVELRRRAR